MLAGLGLTGTLDEVILHQLLHWHHLYDRGDAAAGLVSFLAVATLVLVSGLLLRAGTGRLERRRA